ncbi:MAG TPA: ATPase domain-containing protein, partial [Caulobacteraceae bacterium]|nr:ATPase domain-containing protein [Caulobacteraceae bacterium]
PTQPVRTGVPNLDGVLAGGYAARRLHLIEGQPGAGKTTLGLQFLMEGRDQGERGLYVTLSETREELLQAAATHGWSLEGIDICELFPPELTMDPTHEQTVVYSSDLELGETIRSVMAEIDRVKPTRLVFDSAAEIRLLSQTPLRYRRQILALKHLIAQIGCTALLLDDLTERQEETSLHSLAHGVIHLEQITIQYGAERRRIRVSKMRGRRFRGGYHDLAIRKGGMTIFPRLVAAEHVVVPEGGAALSNVPALDEILGGGLDRGTSSLILGPSGAGKSTLALQWVYAALKRGERVLMVCFDETLRVMLRRASGIGVELQPFLDSGHLVVEQVDPAELSPGELSGMVRQHVEEDAAVVVLDSLSGYQNAMPEEVFLTLQMHELLTYLGHKGVLTILVLAQHGLIGQMQTTVDLTYISDTVLLLRFFEAEGEIKRALSVLKKRTGGHESYIREFRIDAGGIRVGPALEQFQGVLTGVPTFSGAPGGLLRTRNHGG